MSRNSSKEKLEARIAHTDLDERGIEINGSGSALTSEAREGVSPSMKTVISSFHSMNLHRARNIYGATATESRRYANVGASRAVVVRDGKDSSSIGNDT